MLTPNRRKKKVLFLFLSQTKALSSHNRGATQPALLAANVEFLATEAVNAITKPLQNTTNKTILVHSRQNKGLFHARFR